jgi:flagellar basal body P-ring protein FlgI
VITELEGFSQVANDWAMVRAGVFNELNTALEHHNGIAGVLNLARSLVKEREAKEFKRMLPGLFLPNTHSKAKVVETVLVEAVQNLHPSDFLGALQSFADINDENVSKTVIDLRTRILISDEDGEVEKWIAPISETLITTVNSSPSEVRKAAGLCFVDAMTQLQKKLNNAFIPNVAQNKMFVFAFFF